MRDKRRKRKGATLLEIVIALAIIGIMMLPLANSLLTSVKANKMGEELQQAKLLGQEIIEKLKIESVIDSGNNIDIRGTSLELIDNGSIIYGDGSIKDINLKVKSRSALDGYEVDGEINGKGIKVLEKNSYLNVEGSSLNKLGGLIVIRENEIEYVKGTSTEYSLKSLLEKANDPLNEPTIDFDYSDDFARLSVNEDQKVFINISKDNIGNNKIDLRRGDVNIKVNKNEGVLGIYIEEKNKSKFEFNNEADKQTLYFIRNNELSKENGGIQAEFKGLIHRINNIVYYGNDARNGLYNINLRINKDNKLIEEIKAQIYIGN